MTNLQGGFTPTDEQEAIREGVRRSTSSLMIDAYAGVGKTSTLALSAPGIRVPALAVAFNVAIKNALQSAFPGNFKISTMNGLGFGALTRAMPEIGKGWRVEDKKLGKLLTEVGREWKMELSEDEWGEARAAVRQAMLSGIVPDDAGESPLLADTDGNWEGIAEGLYWPDEMKTRLIPFAREVLSRSNELVKQGLISFDDQVYYSTCVLGRFQQFPVLMIDEAQDLSPLMHAMLAKSVRLDGRIIAVGDARQAIYGFRGADSNSLGAIRKLRSDWLSLPLATTFRCPKVVVKRQNSHAPGFRAAEAAPEGEFRRLAGRDSLEGWGWGEIEKSASGGSIAILCRNNAPLIKMAFRLIRQRIPVQMAGRDIGQGLIALSKRLFKENTTGPGEMLKAIDEWEETEGSKARLMQQEEKLSGINDRAESLRAVISLGEVVDAGALREALTSLFSRESGRVTLSTIHRAKGMEWDCVVHLDPWRVPSKQARESGDERAMQQERNLVYVAETRTKRVLLWGDLESFR